MRVEFRSSYSVWGGKPARQSYYITDYISLGVIAKFFPREEVDTVLAQTERASVRERDLPAHVVVYYVIARQRVGQDHAAWLSGQDGDNLWQSQTHVGHGPRHSH